MTTMFKPSTKAQGRGDRTFFWICIFAGGKAIVVLLTVELFIFAHVALAVWFVPLMFFISMADAAMAIYAGRRWWHSRE